MALTNAGQVAAPAPGLAIIARMRGWRSAAVKWAAQLDRTSAARAAGVPIGPAERVFATTRDLNGSPVVATSAAVYTPDQEGLGRGWSRLGWEDINSMRWDDRRGALSFAGLGPEGMWRRELALASGASVVDVARERIASTRLASTTVHLDHHVRAHVTVRRRPGSGRLVWRIVLNGPADLGNPAIREKVHGAISAIQEAAGLPADDTVIPVS